jgi:hypothetical protein
VECWVEYWLYHLSRPGHRELDPAPVNHPVFRDFATESYRLVLIAAARVPGSAVKKNLL